MNTYLSLTENLIWIVVASIIVLFAVFAVITIVARKHRYKKSLRDLEKRYEAAHAILFGQDCQSVRRLEIIAQRNLLFADIHHQYLERYEDIRDNLDHQAEMAIGVLEDLIEKRKYHGLKDSFRQNKEIVLYFVEQVEMFNKELKNVLKDEEKCRVDALSEKEQLRKIKQMYFDHASELVLVEDSFNAVFGNIDKAFERFEECVDCANYEEVTSILKRINEVISELDSVMCDLPVICSLIENVVPSKIRNLKEEYNRMTNNNYPVHHLRVNAVIDEMENELKDIQNRVRSLSLHGIQDELVKMGDRCEDIIAQFALEKEAKVEFEENCDNIYERVNRLEKDFIKMCNVIPETKGKYLIEDIYIDRIEIMREKISQLGTIKRTLDNFIHSSTRQPYSLLVAKMRALKEASEAIINEMDEFLAYLNSLQKDSFDANIAIYEAYFKLKNAESEVRNLNVEEMAIAMKVRFAQCYAIIDKLDVILEKQPINVKELNINMDNLNSIMSALLKDIEDKKALCVACEGMVVYANKDRHRLSDVKTLLNQVETSFFEGDFEKAYCDVGNIVKRIQGHVN